MSDSLLHSRVCTCCLIEKPDSEFYPHKNSIGGRISQCKECCRERNRSQKHRDACKRWKSNNRAHIKAWMKRYVSIPRVHQRRREQRSKYRAELWSTYVSQNLIRHTKLKIKDVPLPLIEAARAVIKLKRTIWQNQKT